VRKLLGETLDLLRMMESELLARKKMQEIS
jgi:hypothetical protein